MNNPWTHAYNHPNFVGYTKEQIDELFDKFSQSLIDGSKILANR